MENTELNNTLVFEIGKTIEIKPREGLIISEESIHSLWENVTKRELEKFEMRLNLDKQIYESFLGTIIEAILDEFTSTIYYFIEDARNIEILNKAEKMNIKKIYTWYQANMILIEAILSGYLDNKGDAVFAYYQKNATDSIYYIYARRSTQSGMLYINMSQTGKRSKWHGKRGVCFN